MNGITFFVCSRLWFSRCNSCGLFSDYLSDDQVRKPSAMSKKGQKRLRMNSLRWRKRDHAWWRATRGVRKSLHVVWVSGQSGEYRWKKRRRKSIQATGAIRCKIRSRIFSRGRQENVPAAAGNSMREDQLQTHGDERKHSNSISTRRRVASTTEMRKMECTNHQYMRKIFQFLQKRLKMSANDATFPICKQYTSNTAKFYEKWLRRKQSLRQQLWEQVCDELQHHHKQQVERHAQQAAHNAQQVHQWRLRGAHHALSLHIARTVSHLMMHRTPQDSSSEQSHYHLHVIHGAFSLTRSLPSSFTFPSCLSPSTSFIPSCSLSSTIRSSWQVCATPPQKRVRAPWTPPTPSHNRSIQNKCTGWWIRNSTRTQNSRRLKVCPTLLHDQLLSILKKFWMWNAWSIHHSLERDQYYLMIKRSTDSVLCVGQMRDTPEA